VTSSSTYRRLLLLSSSFPYGRGEPFLAAEIPFLEEAFDEIIIVSNDVSSSQTWSVGPKIRCERISYEISWFEKLAALRGLFDPSVWPELRATRRRETAVSFNRTASMALSSWAKARKFARRATQIAAEQPGSTVCAYSYWANDMAVAVALARASGIVHRGIARAHGWDVYSSRRGGGVLPFRDYLAHNLDAILFVSEDGRASFNSSVPAGRALREVVHIGTVQRSDGPQGRGEPFTIVSCSVLIPLKRVNLLARAIASCSFPIRWTHVGDGPELAEIRRICASAPSNATIDLPGWLSGEEVIRTWRRLKPSALVNVSSSEGVPVSMMEAMSLGIPVIGTNVGGVSEIVTHGVNGHLLSEDPSPVEIAGAIQLFAEMSQQRFDIVSEAAWRTWHGKFRAETAFRRLTDFLVPSPEAAKRATPNPT
jgi:glycosyltransferase involved in cell wall biosynthesis